MMQTITFECRTITPLVMNGAKGDEPELRPASIKGVLRFWWRALHGNLHNNELRKKEGEIFGNTEQRSRLLIRIIEMLTEKDYRQSQVELLPHKLSHQRSPVDSFAENKTFKIRFDFDKKIISEKELKDLFILTCTLGGFGKRSRRGFGSIEILNEPMPKTLKEIYDLLPQNQFNPLNIGDKEIKSRFTKTDSRDEYPYIKTIEFGKAKTTAEIVNASHEVKEKEYDFARYEARVKEKYGIVQIDKQGFPIPESNFEKALGDGSNRFASPIYVSTIGQNTIITTLNSVPPSKGKREDKEASKKLQEEFKSKLR